ncbi:hypothetical protein HN018_26340 (plasmid) [Lichenicola cladoniae]|uniref:Uncharacterized protein n=1 Tax=Lichenicola cladoniae TaxID=1484109 RepID=A0A6M8HZN1_9PROT|nr:DUF6880 family protein [Lichenicola cladoniae]NPD69343.1 hypothetical protein [Acetobacteraceae bacterium]QKE93667.1 hypothetical protein HN018_26340 [Lichenicola cladoniae]
MAAFVGISGRIQSESPAALPRNPQSENFAGDIAERLITHHRPAEALGWLDRAAVRHDEGRQIDLRIAALDTLGRKTDAQDLRWTTFQRFLSVEHLRAYLRGLPDFDDVADDGDLAPW